MCLCMYVCMYERLYVCMYVCMYARAYARVYARVNVYVYYGAPKSTELCSFAFFGSGAIFSCG